MGAHSVRTVAQAVADKYTQLHTRLEAQQPRPVEVLYEQEIQRANREEYGSASLSVFVEKIALHSMAAVALGIDITTGPPLRVPS